MTELTFQRYQFNFTLQTPLHLDFYAGSLLRGVFGRALRQISCMTKLKSCSACPLYRSCPYTAVFEMPPPVQHNLQKFSEIPKPYIIEPPPMGEKTYQAGETLSFCMVLIGAAVAQLPIIIYAWQQAFAKGVGKYDSTAVLINVTQVLDHDKYQVVYQPALDSSVQSHHSWQPPANMQAEQIRLYFLTPLHLQKQGKTMGQDMTAKDFLMTLVRRYYLLQEFYGNNYQAVDFAALSVQAQKIGLTSHFNRCSLIRYSCRQQQKMRFDGVLGELTLSGNLQEFLPVIHSGQWLHVGNKTTFGMGQYFIAT